jgi:hypothetical protein
MPAAAPVMHYVLHDNLTPTHRARLSKSHKKVEQILGVTPSLQLVPPPVSPPFGLISYRKRSRRHSKTCTSPSRKTKQLARERGKLHTLFGIEIGARFVEDDTWLVLQRLSTDSSSSSSSSSTENLPMPLPSLPPFPFERQYSHQRPRLHVNCSLNDQVLDIRPNAQNKPDAETPLTPLNKTDLGRRKSNMSIIEEHEWNKIIKGLCEI